MEQRNHERQLERQGVGWLVTYRRDDLPPEPANRCSHGADGDGFQRRHLRAEIDVSRRIGPMTST